MKEDEFDPIGSEWNNFANNPKYSLVQKCLKISQLLEYPDISIAEYLKKIDDMGKQLEVLDPEVKNPTYKISILNEYLFETMGFSGDMLDYYNPKNNFLNYVIDQKKGIPITLSILYCEIARYIGLELKPVGFPAHFVVKHNEDMVLDVFNKGSPLTTDQLAEILYNSFQGQVSFSPELLREASQNNILTRILRNLKNSYSQSYNYEKAMRCTNMILSIDPESTEEIRDKGILESRMLNYDRAIEYLKKYVDLNPDAQDVDLVLELIRSIREQRK